VPAIEAATTRWSLVRSSGRSVSEVLMMLLLTHIPCAQQRGRRSGHLFMTGYDPPS
jgi:hypothetical protein